MNRSPTLLSCQLEADLLHLQYAYATVGLVPLDIGPHRLDTSSRLLTTRRYLPMAPRPMPSQLAICRQSSLGPCLGSAIAHWLSYLCPTRTCSARGLFSQEGPKRGSALWQSRSFWRRCAGNRTGSPDSKFFFDVTLDRGVRMAGLASRISPISSASGRKFFEAQGCSRGSLWRRASLRPGQAT